MAFRRDDESLRSAEDPGRSTGPNSIRSRHEPANGNSSSTNVSIRRAQQTPADRSNQTNRPMAQNPDPNSIEGEAGDLLQKRIRAAKEAQQAAKQNENSGNKSRAKRVVDESRGGVKSSPKTPMHGYSRDDIDPSISGSLGAKAHSDKMGQLQQELFDLKVEVNFRREKQDSLETKLERATNQRDDALNERDDAIKERDEALKERDEVNAVNAKLLHEIEMRDEAIYQAAGKIADLEAELEVFYDDGTTIMAVRPVVSSSTNKDDFDEAILLNMKSSPPSKTGHPRRAPSDEPSSTPMQRVYQTSQPGQLVRMPSFLSDHNPETGVLRAMFLPRDQSMNSLAMVAESDDGYTPFGERTLNSPRLSVISQSSLPSVYPGKRDAQQYDQQYESGYSDFETPIKSTKKEFTKSSIKEWAGGVGDAFENFSARERKRERERPEQPMVEPHNPSAAEKDFISMNDIVEDPPLSQRELQRRMTRRNLPQIVNRQRQRFSEARMSDSSPSFQAQVRNIKRTDERDAESFGGGRALPPTPDTFSTNTLQHQVNPSNDTLNSSMYRTPRKVPSFDDNKDKRRSRMEGALLDPNPEPGFGNGGRLRRPRSYTETITSRREGHGWDTATQSEQTVTETNSDFSSEATSKDPYGVRPNASSAAFNPPDIWRFTSPERPFDPRKDEWDISKDIKTPGKQHTHTALGHRNDRDLDHIPTKGGYRERSYSTFSADTRRHSVVGPGTGSSPFRAGTPPERRSSLAATPISNEKRMRRLQENQAAARAQSFKSQSPLKPKETVTSEPLLNASQLLPQIEQPKKGLFQRVGFGFRNVTNPQIFSRGQSNKEKENKQLEEERATPPPIMRRPKAEQARRDAAERHLRPHGGSPAAKAELDRPSTSHGDGRRAVTFGGDEEQKFSHQQQSTGNRDSHHEDAEDMDARKAAEADSTKGAKKWGFSLGSRTLRRK